MKKLDTIGPATKVAFPKLGAIDIPAKIDTGADSSSIWASDLKEHNGQLSFALFGPESPNYTGELVVTKNYSVKAVKNSFGITEYRYKVPLQILLKNRRINATFTLADRSNNNFPVLVGRRTIAGKFLVDVSQLSPQKILKILVIRTKSDNQDDPTASFFGDLSAASRSLNFKIAEFKDLAFSFSGKRLKVTIGQNDDIAKYDLVYFRSIVDNKDLAASAALYLAHRQVPFIDRAAINYSQSLNKLFQYIVLKDGGVSIPDSLFVMRDKLEQSYGKIVQEFGLPFVLKDIRGKRGKNKFLVRDKVAFKFALSKIDERNFEVIIQKFIPHQGHFRLLVIGHQVKLVIFQQHAFSTFRQDNPDERTQAKLMKVNTIPKNIQQMAVEAANKLQLDIAGVDAVQDEGSGQWFILEVNDGPQLATGSFLEEKEQALSQYLTNKYQRNLLEE